MKTRSLAMFVLVFALLLAACSPAATAAPTTQPTEPAVPTAIPPTTQPATAIPAATAALAGPTVQLGQSADLGSFLVDGKGMTLYLFTKDTPNTSNCYEGCAAAWPPLLAEGAPVAGDGIDAALFGLTDRSDGTRQVTYNGWPLYYYVKDLNPGDITGQDVGGVWFVLTPAGEMIQSVAPMATMGSADQANANANANDNANSNSNDDSNTNTNDNSNANSNDNGSAFSGGSVSVDIRNFAYDPSPLQIKVGTTVTWENKDSAPHNVIADNGAFKSGTLREDGKFSFTFTQEGTYQYYCSFHGGPGGEGMSGQVVVTP